MPTKKQATKKQAATDDPQTDLPVVLEPFRAADPFIERWNDRLGTTTDGDEIERLRRKIARREAILVAVDHP